MTEYVDQEMEIPTFVKTQKWSSQELENLIWSINTIHDLFCVLEMAGTGELHEKTLDVVLRQLSKFESLEKQPYFKEVFDILTPLYRGFKQEPMYRMTKLFHEELFSLLANYVDEIERLMIKQVNMGSPGGIKFLKRVKRTPKAATNEPAKIGPQESPLIRTAVFIHDIESKNPNIQIQTIHKNRQVDPRLLDLTTQVLFDGPAEVLSKLAESGKIGEPKY